MEDHSVHEIPKNCELEVLGTFQLQQIDETKSTKVTAKQKANRKYQQRQREKMQYVENLLKKNVIDGCFN